MEQIKIPQSYKAGEKDVTNVIAPAAMENNPNYLKLGDKFVKTIFVFTYPRYLSSGWFNSIINMPNLMDISIFFHPVDTALSLKNLRKKTAQIEAQIMEREEKGLVRDPQLETGYQDIEALRDVLQQGQEKMFNVGVYLALQADSLEELNKLEEHINSLLESRLVYVKPAIFQQIEGFSSTLPLGQDKLSVHTPFNSGPASSLFPFSSMDLTSEQGILYGINRHNNSLIIFDPENEYEKLARSVGGSFFKISLTSENSLNPFDIPIIPKGEDPADVFKSHILNLTGLIKLIFGKIT